MRFTIERLRWLVLAAGVMLIAALAVVFTVDKWKRPFNRRDLPKRLGVDIQQEANGFTYTQAHGGHTLFKIQASRVEQLKQGNALLHEVHIELYGADGSRVDRIDGNEFEYNQQAGTAKANGPVEITLTRPPTATPAAQKAATARAADPDEIHVKTSGLVFDQNSGLASTNEAVEFVLKQGTGSASGATFDSEQGLLVLDRAVKLELQHGAETVRLEAKHGEFERDVQTCRLTGSLVQDRGNQVEMAEATVHFRDDGSASQVEAWHGLTVTSAAGSRLAAPTGTLELDENNHPRSGVLRGGVTVDSDAQGRKVQGSAPTMTLVFTPDGVLRQAHMERGVKMASDAESASASGTVKSHETWTSMVADLSFRDAGHGQLELAAMHGTGGVVVTDASRRGNGPVTPFRMAADEMTGTFGAGSTLTAMTGTGHASMEQTTATGVRQTTNGDRLTAQFAPLGPGAKVIAGKNRMSAMGSSQVESATVEGHVVLVQQAGPKAGEPAPAAMRATADKAVYLGDGGKLRLTGDPRVEDGGLQISARTIDVAQSAGDAVAQGDVKATWMGDAQQDAGRRAGQAGSEAAELGGQGPAHVIADGAELNQTTGEVVFHGHARLWQMTNSISAPVIVLNRTKQTLVARAGGAADPVRVVMVSAAGPAAGMSSGPAAAKPAGPSVIRMRGGELRYSAAERKAVMRGGALGSVVAETADASSSSSELDVYLLPPGNHAGKDGAAAQVDRLTARGHVELTEQGRHGTGEQLEYSSDTGEYVLTGTSERPPRLMDPVRGSVTGEVLIFNTHDDSVKVGSGGRRTVTETTAPQRQVRHSEDPK